MPGDGPAGRGAVVRQQGATVVEEPDASVQLIVVGEEDFPAAIGGQSWFDEPTQCRIEQRGRGAHRNPTLQRLGLVEAQQGIHRLYTPAMLADLLGVPVAVICRWHRRGLIVPAREVRRLPDFDFQEVATARRLADLFAAGVSPQAIEKQLEAISRCLPGVGRPLAELSVIVRGKEILLRQGDGLVEPGGHLCFGFHAWEGHHDEQAVPSLGRANVPHGRRVGEDGQLAAAADMYRAAMAAIGPKAEIRFQAAELLYRSGDLGGVRGTLLHGRRARRGRTLRPGKPGLRFGRDRDSATWPWPPSRRARYHRTYADVHYHLARHAG